MDYEELKVDLEGWKIFKRQKWGENSGLGTGAWKGTVECAYNA